MKIYLPVIHLLSIIMCYLCVNIYAIQTTHAILKNNEINEALHIIYEGLGEILEGDFADPYAN